MAATVPPTSEAPELVIGVVLFWNETAELERLLVSLEQARLTAGSPRFRLEFWDNSCSPEYRIRLETLGLHSVSYGSENLGFGRAHNRLMARAFSAPGVRWYLCLNPDAVVHPDMLSELLRQAARMNRPGLVEAIQFPVEHPKPYDAVTHATPWCSGCALLVSRELYETVGGYDEQIFLYCEDVDLSWRARASGFDIALAPQALIHHYTGDRPPGGRTRLEMIRAGAYLGQKWGGIDFSVARQGEYEALTGEPLKLPETPPPTEAMRGVAEFGHMFHFAKARW